MKVVYCTTKEIRRFGGILAGLEVTARFFQEARSVNDVHGLLQRLATTRDDLEHFCTDLLARVDADLKRVNPALHAQAHGELDDE